MVCRAVQAMHTGTRYSQCSAALAINSAATYADITQMSCINSGSTSPSRGPSSRRRVYAVRSGTGGHWAAVTA